MVRAAARVTAGASTTAVPRRDLLSGESRSRWPTTDAGERTIDDDAAPADERDTAPSDDPAGPVARHPRRDLLWTLPVAAVLCLVPYAVASFVWCGFGCTGDSARGSVGSVIPALLGVGAVMGAAVMVVPWTERRPLRAGVSAAVGLLAALLVGLVVLSR